MENAVKAQSFKRVLWWKHLIPRLPKRKKHRKVLFLLCENAKIDRKNRGGANCPFFEGEGVQKSNRFCDEK